MSKGSCTLAIRASLSFLYREVTEPVIIVIVFVNCRGGEEKSEGEGPKRAR